MADILTALDEFRAHCNVQTVAYLADYREVHADDDPAVVEAYCDGFREAVDLTSAVIAAHILTRSR